MAIAAIEQRVRARAFGLELDASTAVPGLPPAAGHATGRPVRLDVVGADEAERGWSAVGAKRVLEERLGGASAARTIDAHPRIGYRLYARHFGIARISRGGDHVVCAPPGEPDWRWQRFLVGRVLPWTAVLRGYEALHASAAAIGGRAVAFVGPTGAGKTSLALRLVAHGAELVSDDVLVLETRAGVVTAHPGAATAAVRPSERAAMPPDAWARLGSVLGEEDKTYLAPPRAACPLPLAALYFLERGGAPAISAIATPSARLLLASTFVLGVRTPERLRTQLDTCAAIAHGVPLFRLRVTRGIDAGRLAESVRAHLAEVDA